MGANDKVAATFHGRTPDTQIVEHAYVAYRSSKVDLITGHQEFNRWLENVRAEAKAEAWDECEEAWEQAHKMSNREPWDHMKDNPYKEEQ